MRKELKGLRDLASLRVDAHASSQGVMRESGSLDKVRNGLPAKTIARSQLWGQISDKLRSPWARGSAKNQDRGSSPVESTNSPQFFQRDTPHERYFPSWKRRVSEADVMSLRKVPNLLKDLKDKAKRRQSEPVLSLSVRSEMPETGISLQTLQQQHDHEIYPPTVSSYVHVFVFLSADYV